MPRQRHTEAEILAMLKEQEAGMKTADICRKYNVSQNTFYGWRAKYSGLELSDLKKLRALEDENRKLKSIVADLTLDNQALKAVLSKKF
jgi:putative transposase